MSASKTCPVAKSVHASKQPLLQTKALEDLRGDRPVALRVNVNGVCLTPEIVAKYLHKPIGTGVSQAVIRVEDGNDEDVVSLAGAWQAAGVPVRITFPSFRILNIDGESYTFGIFAIEAYDNGSGIHVATKALRDKVREFFADDRLVTVD